MDHAVASIGMNLSVTGCIVTSANDRVKARFQVAKKSFEFGPISRSVSGYEGMARFSVPPRIAFSEPISGSSLLVSQTMFLGRLTGSDGLTVAAGAGAASPAAKEEKPNTTAVMIVHPNKCSLSHSSTSPL